MAQEPRAERIPKMTEDTAGSRWTSTIMETNGVKLHVVQAGPEGGPLAILLHGFPEFWYGWKEQIEPLIRLGYRVLVPDQRGYNLSDKPDRISQYNAEKMALDIVGLIDAVGRQAAAIIAHDWGGHVAWWTANQHPERVRKLVVLKCAHPRVMLRNVLLNLRQTLKSWYVFALQIPWLPELILKRKSYSILRKFISWQGPSGPMSEADEKLYIEAWSQKRAFTSMINWYRAAFRTIPLTLRQPRIQVPTLLIWGEQDRFLDRKLAQQSIDYCRDGRLVYVKGASHWVHHEDPDGVCSLIKAFLSEKE